MGFGTLFIGYFLFLNVTYHGITDVIAGLVMLLGLIKLRTVNKPFFYCSIVTMVFSGFAFIELVAELLKMFTLISEISPLFTVFSIIRSIVIFTLTYFMLRGMEEVAHEVDLPDIASKCKNRIPSVIIIYALWVILEILGLFGSIPAQIPTIISIITLLSTLALIVMNLSLIYKCYMKICMPEDLLPKEKKSRFAFVNKFVEYEEKKQREYAEYKLELMRKKGERQKERKNKNAKK